MDRAQGDAEAAECDQQAIERAGPAGQWARFLRFPKHIWNGTFFRMSKQSVVERAARAVADDLVAAGVKIIFNYSEALLQVPPDVTVHTSSPAVDLLYALYFYLT